MLPNSTLEVSKYSLHGHQLQCGQGAPCYRKTSHLASLRRVHLVDLSGHRFWSVGHLGESLHIQTADLVRPLDGRHDDRLAVLGDRLDDHRGVRLDGRLDGHRGVCLDGRLDGHRGVCLDGRLDGHPSVHLGAHLDDRLGAPPGGGLVADPLADRLGAPLGDHLVADPLADRLDDHRADSLADRRVEPPDDHPVGRLGGRLRGHLALIQQIRHSARLLYEYSV